MKKKIYKCSPLNFTPFNVTPWAGLEISKIKRKNLPEFIEKIPERIGESWEISTIKTQSSQVEIETGKFQPLNEFISQNSKDFLGNQIIKKHGDHLPVLLKWLEAEQTLSVQLHPNNSHSLLKSNESGKPEAWFVINAPKNGFVYLGFKENLSKNEILSAIQQDKLELCLHKYIPKQYDYISIPTGCVHALGPHVLVIEPQYILPNKTPKTWRIFDWNRLYLENGIQSPEGKPRQLHKEESLAAINWDLPQGPDLEKILIQNFSNYENFSGNKHNPFALKTIGGNGPFNETLPLLNYPTIFTVWEGEVHFKDGEKNIIAKAGESGIIFANTNLVCGEFKNAKVAFFALNEETIA